MQENVTKRIHPVCKAPCGQLAQIDPSPDAPASGGMAACVWRAGGLCGAQLGLYQVPLEPRVNHAADDGGVGEQDDSQALQPIRRSARQPAGNTSNTELSIARLDPAAQGEAQAQAGVCRGEIKPRTNVAHTTPQQSRRTHQRAPMQSGVASRSQPCPKVIRSDDWKLAGSKQQTEQKRSSRRTDGSEAAVAATAACVLTGRQEKQLSQHSSSSGPQTASQQASQQRQQSSSSIPPVPPATPFKTGGSPPQSTVRAAASGWPLPSQPHGRLQNGVTTAQSIVWAVRPAKRSGSRLTV